MRKKLIFTDCLNRLPKSRFIIGDIFCNIICNTFIRRRVPKERQLTLPRFTNPARFFFFQQNFKFIVEKNVLLFFIPFSRFCRFKKLSLLNQVETDTANFYFIKYKQHIDCVIYSITCTSRSVHAMVKDRLACYLFIRIWDPKSRR